MPARLRSWWRDLRLALGFMTRLPVGVIEGDLAAASWAFPLAGLLVGGGAALIYGCAIDLGLSALIGKGLGFNPFDPSAIGVVPWPYLSLGATF